MAAQVQTLLHTNPLLQQQDEAQPLEPGEVLEQGQECGLKQSSEEEKLQEKENVDGKERGNKEFREAPPPRVNPWTKKLNAVSMNGQTAPA